MEKMNTENENGFPKNSEVDLGRFEKWAEENSDVDMEVVELTKKMFTDSILYGGFCALHFDDTTGKVRYIEPHTKEWWDIFERTKQSK